MDLADLMAALGRRPGGARQGTVPANGRDYEDTVHISLIDAHRGTTLSLNLADHEDGRTLEIKILPGVREGQKIKLRGKGGKGRHGRDDGDIYLYIALNSNSLFRAYYHDLYFDLALAPWEAALGTELEVPTLDGKALLTVLSGRRTGRPTVTSARGLKQGESL